MPQWKTNLEVLNRPKPMELVLEINSFAGGENTIGEDQALKMNEARYIQNWEALSMGGMERSNGFTEICDSLLPLDDYTKLLIHFDGDDGATAYTAETGQTVTFGGTAQLDTAQKKFGTASLLLDGNSDYVTVPDSANWNFGDGDFTLDCWVMYHGIGDGASNVMMSQYVDANNMWQWNYNDTTHKMYIYAITGASIVGYFSCSWTPTIDTWYHVAVVRNGSTCKMFIDGTSQTVTTINAWGTLPDLASVLFIGKKDTAYMNGWIDEARISKGIARWTANFTVNTSAYGVLYDSAPDLLVQHIEATTTRVYGIIGGKLCYRSSADWIYTDSGFTSGTLSTAVSKGEKLWITNSTDNLKYKTNAGALTTPADVPPSARDRIYYHKYRLVAEGGGKTVYGSRAGTGYWTAGDAWTATNDAWSIDLPDYTYGAVCGFPSGDYITVFTKYGAYLLSNFPNVGFSQIIGGHGCSFPNTIVKGDEGVYFLSQYPSFGIYLWNGVNWLDLTANHDFIDEIDLTRRMFGLYRNGRYYFIYCESGSGVTYPNRMKVYDASFGRWMTRSINDDVADNFGYPCVLAYDNNELFVASSRYSNVYQLEDNSTSDNGYNTEALYQTKDFSSRDFSVASGGEFTVEDVRMKLIKFTVYYYGLTGNLSVRWIADYGKRTGSQTINLTTVASDLINTSFTVNTSYIGSTPKDSTATKSFANNAVGRKFQFEFYNADTNALPKIKRIKIHAIALEEA